MMKNNRPLPWWDIQRLERQGCTASSWSEVTFHPDCDLSRLRNVEFSGSCSVGVLGGDFPESGIFNARIADSTVGDGVTIRNVGGAISNAVIESGAVIENVGRIEFQPEASCGLGLRISVLDETGSRQVVAYPGLSAQAATLMARDPKLAGDTLFAQAEEYCERFSSPLNIIGEGAVIRDSGSLLNVYVGREVRIEGARRLADGMIVNNAAPGRPLAYVGSGVDAEGFIMEDARIDSGAVLRNVYVGQGVEISKGFTAHDSLFFANSTLENGEACSLLAGPYTVSMHKGTLLIGAQTSFMNAGSSTNQSNHMYKLGPVHWGVLERGVKTSSNSYLMLGANIGAFSLLMGEHKTHPDSSEFPFSYLFGDDKGATVVVPAVMLRSCGLLRDEMKWPTRDRRLKRKLPMNDRIVFEVLNPFTVGRILTALETIEELLHLQPDDDRYIRYKGMKISKASLERAKKLYTLAVYKYLSVKLPDGAFPGMPEESSQPEYAEWLDLSGLILTREMLARAAQASSVEEREAVFDEALESYPDLEMQWILSRFGEQWRVEPERIRFMAEEFDHIVEEDRAAYKDSLLAEAEMLVL